MRIPANIIIDYLSEKFPVNKRTNREFLVNSLFAEDYKFHMSINSDTGLWQDFKSGERGNFIQLISHVEGIPFQSARNWVRKKMLDKPDSLFDVSNIAVENKALGGKSITSEFKDFRIFNTKKDFSSKSIFRRLASRFVRGRKLLGKFMFCPKGKFWGRIIIPYLKDGTPYYFQARSLNGATPKYLNPSRDVHGVKSSDVLYPFDKNKEYVFVTEGPIDAITLQTNGINATCTQGSRMSTTQARELRGRKIILSYDNDEPGRIGMAAAKKLLLGCQENRIYACVPPKQYKDWNDFHIVAKPGEFDDHIVNSIFKLDFDFFVTEQLGS
jgi:hypothetical protein